MKLNGYELVMGNNFLRQFKSLNIRYHEKRHEIILGEELPVEAAVISADKCRVQMLRGKLIPKQSIVRVAVAAMGTDEKLKEEPASVLEEGGVKLREGRVCQIARAMTTS